MANVNGREYAVDRLPIVKTLAFVPEVLEAIGPSLGGVLDAFKEGKASEDVMQGIFGGFQSAKVTAVMQKSLAQCVTPENTYLNNAMVFERWFAEYPEDLFQLAAVATWELVKDFLPRQLATLASSFPLTGKP